MLSFIKNLEKVFLNKYFIFSLGVILLGLISFGVPMGNDEGVWAFISKNWVRHGVLPYSGAFEPKTPFIFFVYALSDILFGVNVWFPRVLAICVAALSGLLVYQIVYRVANKRAAALAAITYVLIMPLSALDGVYVETETFVNLFVLSSVVMILYSFFALHQKRAALYTLLSGFFLGMAISTKQVAFLEICPLLLFIYLSSQQNNNKQTLFRQVGLFFVGIIFAIFLTLAPLLLSGGTLHEYIDGAWIVLTQKGLSATTLSTRLSGFLRQFFNTHLYIITVTFLGSILWYVVSRRKKDFFLSFFICWALTDFVIYNAQGFYLNHHFKLLLPSWSILFGLLTNFSINNLTVLQKGSLPELHISPQEEPVSIVSSGENSADFQSALTVVVIVLLLIFYIPFEKGYYYNFLRNVHKSHDTQLTDLGIYINQITRPNDYIYQWGDHNGPSYYYSDRRAPGRYFSKYFLQRPGAVREIQNDFEKHKPTLILVPIDEKSSPEWLQNFIATNYTLLGERYNNLVYRAR